MTFLLCAVQEVPMPRARTCSPTRFARSSCLMTCAGGPWLKKSWMDFFSNLLGTADGYGRDQVAAPSRHARRRGPVRAGGRGRLPALARAVAERLSAQRGRPDRGGARPARADGERGARDPARLPKDQHGDLF